MKKLSMVFLVIVVVFSMFIVKEALADVPTIDYTWVKTDVNRQELQELGVEIEGIQINGIDTGEKRQIFKGVWIPVYKEGIIIRFTEQPTQQQLDRLDLLFSQQNLERENGKSLVDRIEELENRAGIR